MTKYQVGDRVRIHAPGSSLYGHAGTVTDIKMQLPAMGPIRVQVFGHLFITAYKANELEKLNATEVDQPVSTDAAVPASLAGSPVDDGSGAGSTVEHPEPDTQTPVAGDAPFTLAEITERLRRYESAAALQTHLNARILERLSEVMEAVGSPVGAEMQELTADHTTTRRGRVNITKNSKGYSYDTTFEVTSDDPDLDIEVQIADGLHAMDTAARNEIAQRAYIDVEGQPGSDDTPDSAF